ncbi:O-antigen ligase family protein [Devosia aurantiaca]|uniref:O-antigen ligase family protein n=1 Tax=Devosia aurantiaca TaxID=2714858 RepID=A0A6M1SV91_9HYPH|nr:O-antigen ligase family protein [Devosia aurantiaca]NGP16851.1 O-antigen ligase family protein [Devosia aurantiaca]
MPQLVSLLAALALFAGLVLSTPLPEVANIIGLVLMVVALIALFFDRRAREIARQPHFLAIYGAGLLLLLALIPTATSAEHIAAILILAPLWLAGPYAGLITGAPRQLLSPLGIGVLALIGTTASTLIAGYDVFVLQMPRGGFSVNNPIHLADLAVSLGFLSLLGLFSRSRWRFIVLLGPVLALATVLLSASRGPLLAFCVLAAVSVVFYVAAIWRPRKAIALGLGLAFACLVLAAPFVSVDLSGRKFQLADIAQQVLTGSTEDGSTSERLFMLQTAWGAFQASPVYGFGMIDYPSKAAPFGPSDNPFRPSQHLHNDIADFAVIAGSLGLLSYALIILAPLIGGLRTRRADALFIGLMATAGYFTMGLTNAMIGILTQTMLFGLMLALIGMLSHKDQT